MSFKVRLRTARRFFPRLSEFNAAVRRALKWAATWWLTEDLHKHFEPGAPQRYDYAARSERTLKRKRALARRRGEQALPLVMWGKENDALLNRPIGSFNIQATATASKQTVRVPLPVPHPIHPKNKGEVGRLINPVLRRMKQEAAEFLQEEVRAIQGVEERTIG